MPRLLFAAAAWLCAASPAYSQAQIPSLQLAAVAAPVSAAQAQAATPAEEPSPFPVDAYSYRPGGRRDPFASLIGVGSEPRPSGRAGDGPATFSVSEISVRGVIQSRVALVAMVQGPDNKTYVIHQGDKFADGVVKSVTLQGLVVLQDITDPLSMQKQREVRKLLRSLEDAK